MGKEACSPEAGRLYMLLGKVLGNQKLYLTLYCDKEKRLIFSSSTPSNGVSFPENN